MSDPDRWLGLELRHLAALKAVAEEGTFARAAERLGYTQSAVSQRIAALERIVGASLLERLPGQPTAGLTPAGRLMLRHGEAMLARVRAADADLAAVRDRALRSRLRLGTYQSVGVRILPQLLQRFRASWPEVDVQLRESARDVELLDLVERGELDLTFCMLPPEEGPFTSAELISDPYVLVVPRGSPLARGRRITASDIAEQPLIGFRHCRNEHQVDAQLRARGREPHVVFRSDDNPTVQALVASGVGVALMPRLTADLAHPATVCIDMGNLFPPRPLGIVWHKDREQTEPARMLIDLAGQVCSEL